MTRLSAPAGVLRGEISVATAALCAAACLLLVGAVWWFVTSGPEESRWINAYSLPSPASTFGALSNRMPKGDGTDATIPMDVLLIRSTLVSLTRVVLGFALAAAIGVPVGILCGCFPPVNAFFRPLTEFGRNIPMMALLALLMVLLGIDEAYKIVFICLATIAFVVFDTAQAVRDVPQSYVDTAYTLGASRWQIMLKVLVPLAMPSILNSLRLLFGLAFGYITLVEAVGGGGDGAGLGGLILAFQRRGPREGIYLILMLIPLIAFTIDRCLFFLQVQLFPHRFGGAGMLTPVLRWCSRVVEDAKRLVVPAREFRSALPEDSQ